MTIKWNSDRIVISFRSTHYLIFYYFSLFVFHSHYCPSIECWIWLSYAGKASCTISHLNILFNIHQSPTIQFNFYEFLVHFGRISPRIRIYGTLLITFIIHHDDDDDDDGKGIYFGNVQQIIIKSKTFENQKYYNSRLKSIGPTKEFNCIAKGFNDLFVEMPIY